MASQGRKEQTDMVVSTLRQYHQENGANCESGDEDVA